METGSIGGELGIEEIHVNACNKEKVVTQHTLDHLLLFPLPSLHCSIFLVDHTQGEARE